MSLGMFNIQDLFSSLTVMTKKQDVELSLLLVPRSEAFALPCTVELGNAKVHARYEY